MAGPNVRLHPDAIAEAKAAYEWYAERNSAAANAFFFELDQAIVQIQTSPERWTTICMVPGNFSSDVSRTG